MPGQLGLEDSLEFVILVHGVSDVCANSDETPSCSPFQAFCPVLRPFTSIISLNLRNVNSYVFFI